MEALKPEQYKVESTCEKETGGPQLTLLPDPPKKQLLQLIEARRLNEAMFAMWIKETLGNGEHLADHDLIRQGFLAQRNHIRFLLEQLGGGDLVF